MAEDIQAKLNQDRKATATAEIRKRPSSSDTNITSAEFLLIGGLAVIKDLIDVIATVSVVGIILTSLINLPICLMLWLWCISRLKRFPTIKFLTATGLEFIPILGALPLWTAFVVSLWLEQTGHMPKWLKRRT